TALGEGHRPKGRPADVAGVREDGLHVDAAGARARDHLSRRGVNEVGELAAARLPGAYDIAFEDLHGSAPGGGAEPTRHAAPRTEPRTRGARGLYVYFAVAGAFSASTARRRPSTSFFISATSARMRSISACRPPPSDKAME